MTFAPIFTTFSRNVVRDHCAISPRQGQGAEEAGKDVGQRVEPQPGGIAPERGARGPGPLDGVLPLLDPLLGRPAPVKCPASHFPRPSCTTRHSVSPLAVFSHRTSFPSVWRRSNPPKRFGSIIRVGGPPICAS